MGDPWEMSEDGDLENSGLRATEHKDTSRRKAGSEAGWGAVEAQGPWAGCPWLTGGPGCAWCFKTWRGLHCLHSPSPGGWVQCPWPWPQLTGAGACFWRDPENRTDLRRPSCLGGATLISQWRQHTTPFSPQATLGSAYRHILHKDCFRNVSGGRVGANGEWVRVHGQVTAKQGSATAPSIPEDTSRWSRYRVLSLTAWFKAWPPSCQRHP